MSARSLFGPPLCAAMWLVGGLSLAAAEPAKVDFLRDVRPILANHCWQCHGPDDRAREGDLRLDRREAATAVRGDRQPAIVPGRPEASELVARVTATDPESLMPPPAAKKPLTEAQRQTLRDWIAAGAEYRQHWAFAAPQRPAVPEARNLAGVRNPIDRFIRAPLEAAGLSPAPEASRETLLRRATLALTGLPPTLDEQEAFLRDPSPDAYERLVDRLLASPRHAERLALQWLDLARYADTNGYNNDEERSMWPWRDWVIEAFAQNLPYDRFLIEQLAGDLLPEPTLAQRIATGFNRNHVLTTEGGIVEEEYRVEYVADRTQTTAAVFLGLTLQCARCHDHKYDPISQREYYQLYAFFNTLPDGIVSYVGRQVPEPRVKAPTRDQAEGLRRLEVRRRELTAFLQERAQVPADVLARWEANLSPADRERLNRAGLAAHFPLEPGADGAVANLVETGQTGRLHGTVQWAPGKLGQALVCDGTTYVDAGGTGAFDSGERFSLAAWIRPTSTEPSTVLSKMDEAAAHRGYDLILEGGKVACHLIDHWPDNGLKIITRQALSLNEWHHVVVTYDGSRKAAGVHVYVDGKPAAHDVTNDALRGTLLTDKPFHIGRRQSAAPFRGQIDDVRLFGVELTAAEAAAVAAGESVAAFARILAKPAGERRPEEIQELRRVYLQTADAEYARGQAELAAVQRQAEELDKSVVMVMVMQDQPQPRTTHVLRRGQYDQPLEAVAPGVPAIFPALGDTAPRNRLGLAQWLVDPAHPLTARVAVNRWWELLFGTGLVETSEDFGVQGALPSHPELLDWLATELVRSGWDVRGMLRLMATSATFRQESAADAALLERDPRNRLLARGPRFRLPAEVVRDQALAVGGLLSPRIGGPSVKPYQPAGLWEEVSVEHREKYVPSTGEDLYRRSLYTFWKRTCPPPSMTTFDAPDRETCTIRRARTNTPLQALILMNDPTYVEAARHAAAEALRASGTRVEERGAWLFRRVIGRAPRAEELRTLTDFYETAKAEFRRDAGRAEQLLSVGASPRDAGLEAAEWAAWTAAASVLFNLDEFVTQG